MKYTPSVDVGSFVDIDGNRYMVNVKVTPYMKDNRQYYSSNIFINDLDNKSNTTYFNKMDKDFPMFTGILFSLMKITKDVTVFKPIQVSAYKRSTIRIVVEGKLIKLSIKKESTYEDKLNSSSFEVTIPRNQIIVLITVLNNAVISANTILDNLIVHDTYSK